MYGSVGYPTDCPCGELSRLLSASWLIDLLLGVYNPPAEWTPSEGGLITDRLLVVFEKKLGILRILSCHCSPVYSSHLPFYPPEFNPGHGHQNVSVAGGQYGSWSRLYRTLLDSWYRTHWLRRGQWCSIVHPPVVASIDGH